MIIASRILYTVLWLIAAAVWLICLPFAFLSEQAERVLFPFGG